MTAGQSYLEARGIRSETVQVHGLELDSAPTSKRIIERLGDDILVSGRPLSACAKELIWFPHLNSDGAITSWTVRVFPTLADGAKFLTPKGGSGAPFIPMLVWAIADKPDRPLILTEGPVKSPACCQAGFPAIGLNGVYGACARGADDKIILHPSLSEFSWVKRAVYLAFDADITTKFEVRRALLRTCLLLVAQQADVFTITSWDGSEVKGVDDFLAGSENPAAELELLIRDRAPFLSILEKTPADLRLVDEELRAIELPRLPRSQVVRQVAKVVGVTAKDLLTAITPEEVDPNVGREVNLVDETTPWDGPVSGMELFQEIYSLLGRVMWMSDSARLTVTFWLIASYTFKLYRKFPYLRIKSPDKNCGKSTLIDLVAELVFNPLIASDVSPAALYRIVEKFTPTLLLDEFDNKEQVRELTQLLNAGYDNNRSALRYNMDKDCAERFRTYCPKVIASIKRITDTTESRCLPIDLQRVPADSEDKLVELCDLEPETFQTIKRKILAWVEDSLPKIKACRPERPKWLHTRDWDMWRPCYVIATVLGEKRGTELVKQAATGVLGDRVVTQTLAIEILAHIRDAVGLCDKDGNRCISIEIEKEKIFLPSQMLVDYCNGDLEASWADWGSGDSKGLTVHRFAKELRENFKVRSKRIGYQNKDVRGYWLKVLQRHFDSFLPPEDEPPRPGSEAEDRPEGSENPEKENSQKGSKKEPVSGDGGKSSSESTTSRRHLGQEEVAGRHLQKEQVAPVSYIPTISCDNSATYKAQFSLSDENSFLAIDVETSAELERRGKISRDVLDPHKCELRIVSAATPSGNVVVHDLRKDPLPDYLRTAIATMPLLAHGAAFDMAVLEASGIKTSGTAFCTLTASRLLTAGLRDSNDLGTVLKRHLGLELPKEFGASDWGGIFVTDEQLEYCRNDVAHLHALQRALQAKLANPANDDGDGVEGTDLMRVAALEMSLIPLVVDIRLRGIKVDRARLEQILKGYEGHKKELAAELRTEFQAPKLNFASPKQLLCAFKTLGLELPDTSKETLSAVVEPIAGQILRYRELAGLCTTLKSWLEGLDHDNRLYPPLNPLGADTGRFSCQKPNLLAVPRNSEVRACFIPDDSEHVLIESDFANIEMRIAAWFAREKRMLTVFRNGGDIHGETAARVLGDRQARQPAKPVNFGCLYGGGAERLRISARTEFGIEFTPEQAEEYHTQFFNAYSNLRRWHGAAREASSELTYGVTVYGRRRWADPSDRADHRDWNRFQLATNFEVQGAATDALKIALARLYQQFAKSSARILLPVHDSILLKVPKQQAQEVAETVCRTMCEAFAETLGPDFPVAVDTNISERWGEKNS